MKWQVMLLAAALFTIPAAASAQRIEVLPIGSFAQIDDTAPTVWGMSGMEMLRITRSIGSVTPIMRTQMYDARTVEILSRTQAPPLRARDIRAVSRNGRNFITVRRYLLLEVMPADARAEGVSKSALANRWVGQIRRVLPQVAPTPNRFGV